MHFSDLLLRLPNSNLTEGNLSLSTPEFQPLYDQAEVSITGNPATVSSPVGNGILVTNENRIVYKVNVAQPWPCPFDFYQCTAGVTVGIWFWWDSMILRHKKKNDILSLGSVFRFYKGHKNIDFIMRSNNNTGSWFGMPKLAPGKWNLIMWMMNDTHFVYYVNGFKQKTKAIGPDRGIDTKATNEWRINQDLNAGNFSLGPVQVWSGRKSPVLMWRLFQQGLPNYDGN